MADKKPLLELTEYGDPADRDFVAIFGVNYFIRRREDLGVAQLARLDWFMSRYGKLITDANNSVPLTDEQGELLDQALVDIVDLFLEAPADVKARLNTQQRIQLCFAFSQALGPAPKPQSLTPNRTMRRSSGAKSSPRSSASTAAPPRVG